jgi:hypothetical protein
MEGRVIGMVMFCVLIIIGVFFRCLSICVIQAVWPWSDCLVLCSQIAYGGFICPSPFIINRVLASTNHLSIIFFAISRSGPLEAAVAAAAPFQSTSAIADALVLVAALIDVLRIENAALAKCEEAMRAAEAAPIQNCMSFGFFGRFLSQCLHTWNSFDILTSSFICVFQA